LQGGALPPLNVFHNPIWMNSKGEDSFNLNMNNFNPNDPAQLQALQRLNLLNKELDEELHKLKPNGLNGLMGIQNIQNIQNNQNSNLENNFPKFMQLENQNQNQNQSTLSNYNSYPQGLYNSNAFLNNNLNLKNLPQTQIQLQQPTSTIFPRINGLENTLNKPTQLDFTNNQSSAPLCIRREGMLKIRDVDQKDKDVVVTYAVLTKDRLSYFVNAKDESSIQGSIDLGKIKESLKLINGFPTCFTIKTLDGVSDCSVCAESDDSAREWINAITQNAVNCNTMSALNNLNKRGLLK
jgi:hypothetical protein